MHSPAASVTEDTTGTRTNDIRASDACSGGIEVHRVTTQESTRRESSEIWCPGFGQLSVSMKIFRGGKLASESVTRFQRDSPAKTL